VSSEVTRFRSEEEYQAEVERRARWIWDMRERKLWGSNPQWKRFQQRWDQASVLARELTIEQAKKELANAP
jgi:hypothetical protein